MDYGRGFDIYPDIGYDCAIWLFGVEYVYGIS